MFRDTSQPPTHNILNIFKRMRNTILTLACIFCFIFSINGQGWFKNFTGPETVRPGDVIASNDGNYIAALSAEEGVGNLPKGSYLYKISPEGNLIWIEKFNDEFGDAEWFCELPNGGYVLEFKGINAVQDETVLIKLNDNFEQIASVDVPHIIAETATLLLPNNEIIYGTGGTGNSGIIQKFDEDLNQIWEITYPEEIKDLDLLPDGNIIGTALTSRVFKMTTDGVILWERELVSTLQTSQLQAHPMDDGSITLFTTSDPAFPPRQLKLDENGNLLWVNELLPGSSVFVIPLEQVMVSDGFISSGQRQSLFSQEGNNVLLIKSDFEGNVIWEKNMHNIGVGWEFSRQLVATPDDGIIGMVDYQLNPVSFFNQHYIYRVNSNGNINNQELSGKIAFDATGTCAESISGLNNWTISASNDETTVYGVTDINGSYLIDMPVGIYTVTVHPPNNLWQVCNNDTQIGFVDNAQLTRNFSVTAAANCPAMAIQTSFPIARPCFDNNTFYISYCNEGTVLAIDASVEIIIDTTLFTLIGTTLPNDPTGSDPGGGQNNVTGFEFFIGDIQPGECGNFSVNFMLDCDIEVSETVCLETNIHPVLDCNISPDWNGAFIEANVLCEQDSITFTIENSGTEDMSQERNFIVIEDALVLIQQQPYNLTTNDFIEEKFVANGSTYRLEAEQEAFAPGDPLVMVWVEGCGVDQDGDFSTGFVNLFSLGDNIPYSERDCAKTTSAFDPNDKRGFPLGVGDEHYIEKNTDIEYMIRFQNTGNDTAFTVVLLDTIPAELDLSTITVGPASHNFEWTIVDGNVLQATFNEILLPDSTTNLDASNGFLEFKIAQQLDLEDGTVIRNDAGIFFDFNEVILTEESFHTIGELSLVLSTQNPISELARIIEVYPNPFTTFANFKMKNLFLENAQFELFDINGKLILQEQFSGNEFRFNRNKNIHAGSYFYKITDNKIGIINSGQLSIQ